MISCEEYSKQEKERLKDIISTLKYKPRLNIIQVGDNQASNAYVKGKVKDCEEIGIKANVIKFPKSVTTQDIMTCINGCNEHNIPYIVQLPLPKHINLEEIKEYYNPKLDVDGFLHNSYYTPCTPRGIVDWLEYNNVDLTDENVVILGRSEIVGKPLAKLMTEHNANVTLLHSKTSEVKLIDHLDMATIIVSAVGKIGMIKKDDYFCNRPIIIDVGINRDENGKLCGDVSKDFDIMNTEYVTPVPKGVGLLTRVSLLKNVVDAYMIQDEPTITM